jgi:hypothetical protein
MYGQRQPKAMPQGKYAIDYSENELNDYMIAAVNHAII